MRLGCNRGGEKYRIDRRAVARRRLSDPDTAAEQAVLGDGRRDRFPVAHLPSLSAAASSARARR